MIERNPPRAGVAGWPVEHSRSPMIHRYWLKTLGISGSYERFPFRPENLWNLRPVSGARRSLARMSRRPIRRSHSPCVIGVRRLPDALGAVNTLWREDGRLWGDNTDVAGFLANMDEAAPAWDERAETCGRHRRRRRCSSSRSCIEDAPLQAHCDRQQNSGPGPKRSPGNSAVRYKWRLGLICREGLRTPIWSSIPASLAWPDSRHSASILARSRRAPLSPTSFTFRCPHRLSKRRARVACALPGGWGMLLHQAAPAFERWFGQRPDVTSQLRALVEADIVAAQEGR